MPDSVSLNRYAERNGIKQDKLEENHLENREIPDVSWLSSELESPELLRLAEFIETEELNFSGISRNKRAIIERLAVLWMREQHRNAPRKSIRCVQ